MQDYTPNSFKYREEQARKESEKAENKRKIEKVVSGKAKIKKKSQARKVADSIMAENATSVGSYILSDVIIPSFKKLITDMVKDGIEMLLWGGTKRESDKSRHNVGYVSYNKYSSRRDEPYRSDYRRDSRRSNYEEIVLETRGDAEEVLITMEDLIDRYGFVSMAELYELVDLPGEHTDFKYGWDNLRSARVVRVRDGYVLDLPRPKPAD